ncbi:CYFA0S16e02014g1_1 [Cyberlindnera fabianii]|uniref:CYFA0S16e02014g1_1 n=1 Tax=Cyberlindnera fabianii TaxID=36022 RepID=A0A061B5L6_CYBFA|nr:CYFA0S16e02014g1_1 [Cyberlindnera fabianii]
MSQNSTPISVDPRMAPSVPEPASDNTAEVMGPEGTNVPHDQLTENTVNTDDPIEPSGNLHTEPDTQSQAQSSSDVPQQEVEPIAASRPEPVVGSDEYDPAQAPPVEDSADEYVPAKTPPVQGTADSPSSSHSVSAEPAPATKDEEEEDDDDYDPTAESLAPATDTPGVPSADTSMAIPGLTAPPTTSATPQLNSAAVQLGTPTTVPGASTATNSQPNPAIDQTVLVALTQRLLSDPSFMQLSDTEKQQRIALEYSNLQSPAASNAVPLGSARSPPPHAASRQRRLGRKPFEFDPRAPHRPDLNYEMTPEETAEFRSFLKDELQYNTRYPHKPNTRLFVGNVPTNHMGKTELWRVFKVHGRILQVSLKAAYGFVQYDDPESVKRAMELEKAPLYGKVLKMEVAKKAEPAELASFQKSGQSNSYRERDEKRPERSESKKRRVDVEVLIQPQADSHFGRDVARAFENRGISSHYTFVRRHHNIDTLVSDAAYSGVVSVIMVSANHTVDAQIYEKTADGSVRFDEYVALSLNDALNLVAKAKEKQGPTAPQPSRQSGFGGGFGSDRDRRDRDFESGRYDRNKSDHNRFDTQNRFRTPSDNFNRGGSHSNAGYGHDNNRGPTGAPSHSNDHSSSLPDALLNLTPEQFRELGARLGYQQPGPAPVQPPYHQQAFQQQPYQQQPYQQQPQQQIPPNAIAQLLSGAGASQQNQTQGPNTVQALLDSLNNMQRH